MRFQARDQVRVKVINPQGNRRTPEYVKGKRGVILTSHGVIGEYEDDHADFRGPTYSVLFNCLELFGKGTRETVVVDIHEQWLDLDKEVLVT